MPSMNIVEFFQYEVQFPYEVIRRVSVPLYVVIFPILYNPKVAQCPFNNIHHIYSLSDVEFLLCSVVCYQCLINSFLTKS